MPCREPPLRGDARWSLTTLKTTSLAVRLDPPAGVPRALARHADGDLDPAHHHEAAHLQAGGVAVGIRHPVHVLVAVLERTHDRDAARVHGQVGRNDDLHTAHCRKDEDLGDAGPEAGIAEVQLGATHECNDDGAPRGRPRAAALYTAHDRDERLALAYRARQDLCAAADQAVGFGFRYRRLPDRRQIG